ncbi:MAG: Transglutaminase-like protein [Proteobacteria bacterium]|nr:Transglutaminase-like protein [Pseudomonadota bacterium]
MNLKAQDALDRSAVPWLFAVALATTLPHFLHLSTLLSAFAALLLAWGSWLWWRGTRLPNRWLIVLCTLLTIAIILLEFRTLFGREAGTAMLVIFTALKLMEIRSRRDAYVSIMLGYFVLLTHFFDSESIPTGLWLIACVILITATLIRLHGGVTCKPWAILRRAGIMTAQALPLMLVLYVLFPRINGPLWGMPKDAYSARTGLSDQMSPGSISNLAQSGEIVLRARFNDTLPERNTLYWRGPVLEETNGSTWSQATSQFVKPPVIEAGGQAIDYNLTLEPHQQYWLLALDAPVAVPGSVRIAPTLTAYSRQPIRQRQRYELAAQTSYRFNINEAPQALKRNLSLPPGRNPRTRALAESWRMDDTQPDKLVQKALSHFRQEKFFYTLRPPLLGTEPMDDFLFLSRRGFCEHYAAAFVTLMRAAGVPARVVTGYQGGEMNPVDNYLVVRQSDAHAWAEVWLAGRGWIRIDPTAAVSPSRIEGGISTAMSGDEPLPALVQINSDWLKSLRYRWEAINNGWNQWVLGYNAERQRDFLQGLGIEDPRWQTLGMIMLGVSAAILLAVSAWILYHRPRLDPARKLWNQALRHLHRSSIDCADWEAPLELATRLQRKHPEIGRAFEEVARLYVAARYGRGPINLEKLRQAVKDLP